MSSGGEPAMAGPLLELKNVGARQGDILQPFLIESVLARNAARLNPVEALARES